jgi:hypothetical protein
MDLARAYALTGQTKKAQELIDQLWRKSAEYMMWYCSLDGQRFESSQQDCILHLYILNQVLDLQSAVDEKKAEEKDKQFQTINKIYTAKGGTYGQ